MINTNVQCDYILFTGDKNIKIITNHMFITPNFSKILNQMHFLKLYFQNYIFTIETKTFSKC